MTREFTIYVSKVGEFEQFDKVHLWISEQTALDLVNQITSRNGLGYVKNGEGPGYLLLTLSGAVYEGNTAINAVTAGIGVKV